MAIIPGHLFSDIQAKADELGVEILYGRAALEEKERREAEHFHKLSELHEKGLA